MKRLQKWGGASQIILGSENSSSTDIAIRPASRIFLLMQICINLICMVKKTI